MRRLIKVWLLVSVFATAGIYAYVQYAPHSPQPDSQVSPSPSPESPSRPQQHAFRARSVTEKAQDDVARAAGGSTSNSSSTEQLALMISIGSSVISALAAVMQTWLTHRSVRAGR